LFLDIIGGCKLPHPIKDTNGFLLGKDGFNSHLKLLNISKQRRLFWIGLRNA